MRRTHRRFDRHGFSGTPKQGAPRGDGDSASERPLSIQMSERGRRRVCHAALLVFFFSMCRSNRVTIENLKAGNFIVGLDVKTTRLMKNTRALAQQFKVVLFGRDFFAQNARMGHPGSTLGKISWGTTAPDPHPPTPPDPPSLFGPPDSPDPQRPPHTAAHHTTRKNHQRQYLVLEGGLT